MTKSLPFTEQSIRRAIAAARKEGLDVGAITVGPDGSITIHQQGNAEAPATKRDLSKWLDVEA